MRALDNTADRLVLGASERIGPTPPEAKTVAHTPKGDALVQAQRFRAVYDEHFAFVYRCVAHRGIARSAIDDVVQEVFIVVHRKLPEFEGLASLRTWLAAIIRRVIADFVKKRGNRPAADETLEHEPVGTGATSEALEQKAAAALLDQLLAKMTDDQREVFVLHEIEHLNGAEIAEATGANENTVRTRLRAARRIFEEGVVRQRARQAWEQT